jgi:hypothetical protein
MHNPARALSDGRGLVVGPGVVCAWTSAHAELGQGVRRVLVGGSPGFVRVWVDGHACRTRLRCRRLGVILWLAGGCVCVGVRAGRDLYQYVGDARALRLGGFRPEPCSIGTCAAGPKKASRGALPAPVMARASDAPAARRTTGAVVAHSAAAAGAVEAGVDGDEALAAHHSFSRSLRRVGARSPWEDRACSMVPPILWTL